MQRPPRCPARLRVRPPPPPLLPLLPLLVLSLLLCHGAPFAAAAATTTTTTTAEDGRHASCGVEFAPRYFATIATTIPVADRSTTTTSSIPLAHTSHLYVDEVAGAVRMDHFRRGHRITLLLDNRRLRGVVFFGERDAATTMETDSDVEEGGQGDVPRRRCHVFYLPRPVAPFCVPRGYTAAAGGQPSIVRGAATTAFTGMEGVPQMPLVEQVFYVVNASRADVMGEEDLPDGASPSVFVPWRLEYRARPDLEAPKLAAAPSTLPNWRFFGHPMFDELVLSPAEAAQLQRWQPVVDLMTMDFYDYFVTEHPAGTFAVPPQCTAVLRRDDRDGSAGKMNAPVDGEGEGEPPQLQLASLQRFLLQWHRLQNISTAHLGMEKRVNHEIGSHS